MSTHTIQDELTQLAKSLGIDVSGSHNIKDVLRKINQARGGNSNGQSISEAVRNMKQVVPFPTAAFPSAMAIANVTLSPTFSSDIYAYVGTASAGTGALTFTEDESTTATITFNGTEVESGDTLEFVDGVNVLVATVSDDDVYPISYTITFPYHKTADDLTALAITNVTFDPEFDGDVYEYEGTIAEDETEGVISWTAAANNTVTATINGEEIESSGSTIDLTDDTIIELKVSKTDSWSKVYTVHISTAEESDD